MPDEPDGDSFATVPDLEGRWHALTEAERARAALLLADASQYIRDECPGWEASPARTRTAIVCAMVQRAMLAGDRMGVTNSQQTAGSFSESVTYGNPMGDLYLTEGEKGRLRGGRGRAYHLDLSGANPAQGPFYAPREASHEG